MSPDWRAADDADVVHALIEASDRAAAARTGTEAPRRRRESTQRLVSAGVVRLGLLEGRPVVTVTVGPEPSFDPAEAGFPETTRPWYMQRLAVMPGVAAPLVGFHAVRHAVEVARAAEAGALRAEANPDLADVLRMLETIGFVRWATDEDGALRRTFLQLPLRP